MNWPVVGWPTQSEFRPSTRPDRSPRSDNVRAALGWPGEPQANTGLRWRSIKSPADIDYRSVCWSPELRLFCAVAASGTGGRIATSFDGLSWTRQQPAVDSLWYGVCWSPQLRLFCAVSNDGNVSISPNGRDWTLTFTSGPAYNGNSVCWSPSLKLFCACGDILVSADISTSPDGINWTNRVSGTVSSGGLRSVIWAEELGLFIALSSSTNANYTTSPDGITWTNRTLPSSTNWQSLAWSKKRKLLVAAGGLTGLASSSNGTSWTTGSYSGSNVVTTFNAFASEETGLFHLIGSGNFIGYWSGSGFWDTVPAPAIPATNLWRSACYAEELNRFVAVTGTGTGNRIMVSP